MKFLTSYLDTFIDLAEARHARDLRVREWKVLMYQSQLYQERKAMTYQQVI